jgi:sugar lactone lactonase YvrE
MVLKAERLVACGNGVGESPVWDATNERLLWLDIPKGRVQALTGGQMRSWDRPTMIGSIALASDGGLIAGTQEGFAMLRLELDEPAEHDVAAVLAGQADMRMNDGACDRQGRFWSGSMALRPAADNPVGRLYRLDGAAGAEPVADGFVIQNGLAWSLDGRTMYVSDSHTSMQTVWAFDYDTERGVPSKRRVFATGALLGGRPDGAAVDSDGCYWIAASDGGKVVRLTPRGQIDAEVLVPTRNPTNLCFGGPDLRTMFVTSLRAGDAPDSEAGNVFAVETPWQGLAETPFRAT